MYSIHKSFCRPLTIALASVVGMIGQGASAQTIDWTQLQADADAAFDQAQAELRDTDATIHFTRSVPTDDWTITITGTVGGILVDYSGTVTAIDDTGENPIIIASPAVPAFSISADMLTPIMRAAALSLQSSSSYQTELIFQVDAPLEDSADPQRFDGIDISTLAKYTLTQITTASPELSLHSSASGLWLSTSDSYFSMATDFGLSKESVQEILALDLEPQEISDAFEDAAIKILGDIGISEESAREVYALRCSLGKTPNYYQQAFTFLVNAGEPVQQLIANGSQLDDPDGPLARVQDPGDIEIELEGTTEVEVSVPPFVKVKVRVTVRVKGTLSEVDELRQALQEQLAIAAEEAKKQAEEALESLREAIDELIRIFKQYMDNLDIPAWLEWLLR